VSRAACSLPPSCPERRRDGPDRDSRANSFVDVPVQAELSSKAGDTIAIAIECVGGSAGYSAAEESIALIPMS